MNLMGVHQYRLYVVGDTPAGQRARDNFKVIQEVILSGNAELEIVDVLTSPERAEVDRIVAVPALVRIEPPPSFKIIGDLSDSAHLRSFFAVAGRDDDPQEDGT